MGHLLVTSMHSGAEVRAQVVKPATVGRAYMQSTNATILPCAVENQAPTKTSGSQRAMVEVATTKDKALGSHMNPGILNWGMGLKKTPQQVPT